MDVNDSQDPKSDSQQPMTAQLAHEAVSNEHGMPMPALHHQHQHQPGDQDGGMEVQPQVVASSNGLDVMHGHSGLAPFPTANQPSVSMFPGHPVSMPMSSSGVMPNPPGPMQAIALEPNQQVMGRSHVIGALQLFEAEFHITVEEHNDTSCFTSNETKGNHSSTILDKVLSCAPIRQRLNLIPIPIELYSQAVQLFRAKGRVVYSSHLDPQDKKQGARVASYVCNACQRQHGITSAIRHCIRSLRAEIKHDEIDWSTWAPCPWTVFGRDFVKSCLRPVPRLITNKRTPDSSRRPSKVPKRYYDDEVLDLPTLNADLVNALKQPLSSRESDGLQFQIAVTDRLNALSGAVLMLNDALERMKGSNAAMKMQDMSSGGLMQLPAPHLQVQQLQPQPMQTQQMQQQLQPQLQPQVLAVSTAAMVTSMTPNDDSNGM
eukprot:TRINITY_DN3872_c0_g1_i1.p1 TRINITY_DN3872_c0_g1~~TRINITY_DN3872_c0_g1_i1.p1  ORF type:complete len:460 (+),score=87.71 TRINITY_DN3872_c0_g1_i1:86-1381(+)